VFDHVVACINALVYDAVDSLLHKASGVVNGLNDPGSRVGHNLRLDVRRDAQAKFAVVAENHAGELVEDSRLDAHWLVLIS